MAKQNNVPANRNTGSKAMMKMNIPQSFVTALSTPAQLEGGFGINSPYVQFVHPQAKNYQKLMKQIRGLGDDTIALVYPGEKPAVKLDPFKFSLVQLYQYWAILDAQGNPTQVFWNKEDAPRNAQDMVDTIVVVYTQKEACMARCLFKSTKGKAIRAAHQALEETTNSPQQFAERGAEFKAAQDGIEIPYLRFYTEVDQTRRISQSNNLPYYLATGTVHATTSTEWAMIGAMFNDKDFEKQMQDVLSDFEARNNYLQNLNK